MLPVVDRVIFGKAPLRLVVGQLRFPIIPRFGESAFIASFHEAIRSRYPRVSREQQVAIKLSPKGMEPTVGEMLWRFETRDNQQAVVVGESALTLEAHTYSSIDDFLAKFESLLQAARETMQVSERVRIGLRHINEIRLPDAQGFSDWRRLLRQEFVGFAAPDLLGGDVERTLVEMQVRRSDGTLAIHHGFLTGTVVAPRPEAPPPPNGPFYLIDLDYYDTTECELDIRATIAQMRAYNEFMYRFLRWTLSDELYNYLEPRHVR